MQIDCMVQNCSKKVKYRGNIQSFTLEIRLFTLYYALCDNFAAVKPDN